MERLHHKGIASAGTKPEHGMSAPLWCSSSGTPVLSKETLASLEELGDVLLCIHKRMVSEGYEIVDGDIRKIDAQNRYE